MSLAVMAFFGTIALILLMFAGMPIAYAMALTGLVGIFFSNSIDAGLSLLARDFWQVFSSYDLSVVPMFVLMGEFAFNSGISRRLYASAYAFLGHLRGGLALAATTGCALFAAVCGSTSAEAAAMGRVTIPEMQKYGYDPSLATACVAAGGSLGILIPPSTAFIVYGLLTGESIGKLFIAGILPGILLTVLFMIAIYIQCRINPKLGPAGPNVSWKKKISSLSGCLEMLVLFVLVMGGLFAGIFTATEAGAVGAAGTLAFALIRRQMNREAFIESILDTTLISGMVFVILGGAFVFGRFIAYSRITFDLIEWLSTNSLPPYTVMWLIIIFYFIAGCFMDMLALVCLTIPILFPVITHLGFDPIWFGVLAVLCGDLGVITPPVGINAFIIHAVAPEIPLETIFKGVWPFVIAIFVCIAFVMYFPQIATLLPYLMMGK